MANDAQYGLAAGTRTKDVSRAHRIAKRLQAGTVWIKTYRSESFALPLGGYKATGYAPQNSLEAIREITQTKSI